MWSIAMGFNNAGVTIIAVRNANAAIMLTHAENDFGITAGSALAAELERLHKPYVLKIYPPVGLTSDDGP